MAKTVRKKKQKSTLLHHPEAYGLGYICLSLLLCIALVSFTDGNHEANWLGMVGHVLAFGLHFFFGLGGYLIAFFMLWMGWCAVVYPGVSKYVVTKVLYFLTFLFSTCILLNVVAETKPFDFTFLIDRIYSQTATIHIPAPIQIVRYNLGGVPLYYLYRDLPFFNLQHILGDMGVFITFSLLAVCSFILLLDVSFAATIKSTCRIFPMGLNGISYCFATLLFYIKKPFVKEVLVCDAIEEPPRKGKSYVPPLSA